MPYNNKSDLPETVTKHLPAHAQDIYLQAFNHAWEEYKAAKKRRGNETREEVSHKVAWSAVKKKYRKNTDGNWVEKL